MCELAHSNNGDATDSTHVRQLARVGRSYWYREAGPLATNTGNEKTEALEILSTEAVISEQYKALDLSESIGELAALCLSGGGIRSAEFCLGALQSFAREHLLHEFHYLSAVSSGGYIGGWLTRCIAAQADQGIFDNWRRVERPKCSVEVAEDDILKDNCTPAIDTLQAYRNYLTPHSGLVSSDTWAGSVTARQYAHQLVVNRAAIAPGFTLPARMTNKLLTFRDSFRIEL